MQIRIHNLPLLKALTAAITLILVRDVAAQSFTVLCSFTNTSDGANPYGLLLSGQTLYGAAAFGGRSGNGTVFSVRTDGTGFTNLYSFTAVGSGPDGTNSDGSEPNGLVLLNNTLYGTTTYGGSAGNGTVFAIHTDGTGFTNLHNFTALDAATETVNSDGANPFASLISSGNVLYGTAQAGGSAGNGTVFALNTDGTGFTNLHSFTALDAATGTTNSDGADPYAALVLLGGDLYGTAQSGGSAGNGTVFALNTDGTGFTNLHNFTALDAATDTVNSDGAEPFAGLVLSGKTLYGTAYSGGETGNGTVFALNSDGSGFTNLHSFTALDAATDTINSDGANPSVGLIVSRNTLYGSAYNGGSAGNGTVFSLGTDGSAFTILHSFTALDAATESINSDGANPSVVLVLSGDTLFGAAFNGGSSTNGTVFSISLPQPQLTITPSGQNVILTWPTNAAGFSLQAAKNLVTPLGWGLVIPGPVVVDGQNTVTNRISGNQQFFRLSQ